jgi:adenine-specific DNA methylase
MQQRFIEYDLPLAEISEASAQEKKIRHGHPSSLHIWWARRPLASSRATALAALLDDPGPHEPKKRHEIRELIKEITPWEAAKNGNSVAIQKAQKLIKEQYSDEPPKVLDPFAGGGAIPLEALRLGCETYASDYNPVAVFIEKATLEWPQKFGVEVNLPENEDDGGLGLGGKKVNLLAYVVEKWANKILQEVREEIGQFYPTESGEGLLGKREVDSSQDGWAPIGYLWARTIPCQNPTCNATIPLIKQFWLCKKSNKKIAYRPVVDREKETVDFELLCGEKLQKARDNGFNPANGTISRANASCPVCSQVTKAKQTRKLAREGQMDERLVVAVLHHPDEVGRKYRLSTDRDRLDYSKAKNYLQECISDWPHLESPLPEEELAEDPRNLWCYKYGVTEFKDLFNSRQQLAMVAFLNAIKRNFGAIESDSHRLAKGAAKKVDHGALARAVMGYLALTLTRTSEFLSRATRWKPSAECPVNVFSRQAIPMLWDYEENNPFSGASGSWQAMFERMLYGSEENIQYPWDQVGCVQHGSATSLPFSDNQLDAILTDPPYYDNVPYASLSDFFYVWLKRTVGEQFPELFSTPTVPKSEEAIMEPTRHESKEEAKVFFERMLSESFQEMHRVLKPEGVVVAVYAHKTTEGWETMLNGLIDAGFVVTGSWPIHTEMKARLRSAQSAALASSIYMVCRKTEREPLGFWNDIQPQIKQRVEEKLEQFWEADVIRGGDFFISAIGPGMEAYSRFDRVETYDGDIISVFDLLQYIRGVATDFLVKRLLRDVSSGAVDKEAQFYLTYRWTFQDTRVEYDDALRIAKAEGLNLDRVADTDSFIKKTRKYIYVHGPQDRDAVKEVHNMVDAMHLACRMWSTGRKDDVGPLLAKHGYNQSPSFWQFCQAIAECLPEGNKEKQWLEGMLMSKDQYQQAESAGAGDGQQGQIEIEFDE